MKKNNGCMTAFWIVAGILGLVLLIHLGIAFYFLQAKFKLQEVKYDESSSSAASMDYNASSFAPSDFSSAPATVALPAAKIVTKGEFTRDRVLNMGGFYFPIMDIRAGNFRLETIDMASDKEFLTFESKGQTIPTWTPFQIVFSDMSSKEVSTETGLHRENMPRVFCKAYSITRDSLTFKGYDKQVGEVTFTGKIDPNFLAQQANDKTRTGSSSEAVIIGTLTVGDKTFTNVSFSYWMGD
jgi:hypothetical protein